ncbi:MAG TPA: hypothetical protein VGE12_14410 [Noviherbaspirillum sp.]
MKVPLPAPGKAVEKSIPGLESIGLHLRRREVAAHPEYRGWHEEIVTERYCRNTFAWFR